MSIDLKNIKDDFRSGLVVSLVAIPLCLGISLASGAPLLSGLIAGIIGGLVVGSVSNSHLSVSGPAAGLAVVVLTAITDLGSFETFIVAVALSGVIQIALGLIKAGVIAHFIPNSVIKGMLAAIGILIAWKQLPYVFGYQSEAFAEGANQFGILNGYTHTGAMIIGVASLITMLGIEKTSIGKMKIFKIVPPVLIVVVLATIAGQFLFPVGSGLNLGEGLLVDIGQIAGPSDFFASLVSPNWSALTNVEVWKTAVVIALVASIETLLCIEAADKMDPNKRRTSTNRELIAQGSGNLLSGLIGGLPITSVIVRSSVNLNSGAKSKMSAVFHGGFLLFSVLAIPMILNMIPLATLAVILVLTGFKLNPASLYRDMYSKGHQQLVPFLATIVGVVATDLLSGVFIGMAFAVFMVLKENYHIQNSSLKPAAVNYSNDCNVVELIFSEYSSFLTRGNLQQMLKEIGDDTKVIINTSKTITIDHDVIEVINEFKIDAKSKNIKLEFEGPHF